MPRLGGEAVGGERAVELEDLAELSVVDARLAHRGDDQRRRLARVGHRLELRAAGELELVGELVDRARRVVALEVALLVAEHEAGVGVEHDRTGGAEHGGVSSGGGCGGHVADASELEKPGRKGEICKEQFGSLTPMSPQVSKDSLI